jgi:acyl-CoA thioesterase-1
MTDFMTRRWLCLLWLWCGLAAAAEPPPVILVMGDSLAASYGVPNGQGWVALLQQRLADQGYPYRLVNASIGGETSAGGRARLPTALAREHPRFVLIELGGNDGLRGLQLKDLRDNLGAMIEASRQAGAEPVLFEMRMPPNYGAYADAFTAIYATLAQQHGLTLVPFLLAPIAADPGAFQEDGIHPNAAVQGQLLDTVWPTLQGVLDRARKAPASRKPHHP